MLCSRCKKRQAVVFITGMINGEPAQNTGLCLTCAREMGIPQVESIMKQMGLDDDDVENMENHLAEIAESGALGFPFPLGGDMDDDMDDEDEEDFLENMQEEIIGILSGGAQDDDYSPSDAADDTGDSSNDAPFSAELAPTGEDGGDNHAPSQDDTPSQEGGEEAEEKPKKRPMFPFEQLFGGSFQPGGAGYADDRSGGKEKGKKKGKKDKGPKYKFLDTYCNHLTARARAGKIDRIIGRDREIERIVQILSRRQKNNPCLIGEPGVGKTAIAEGLALRIASGDVPARLARKELYLLDLTALVAGTQFRGQFESRIKGLIDEVKSVGNIILFIDEVHNLVGTGDAEGSMNAANILKPALSRGELQVIGATTFTEYRKYIEKDSALERRFQPVKIDEPSVADTIEVLRGIKDYYEQHHGVVFSDALIVRAVNLSERYITDRFLPDKAIDLLDEACACAALRNKAREETTRLRDESERLSAELDALMGAESEENAEPDYARIAEIRSSIMRIDERIAELAPEAGENDVRDSDLAKVIELWTGIQASRIEQSEYAKLHQLADRMKERIKGQDEAIELVASAVRRGRVQISPRRRPASFIFVGPTGVGKTELVKVLASELFDTPETLIRLDMSEFMEKHSVSRIIGSPPGYVGYDEAGQLTEKVRRKPYSVILLDEIEKAHPDVMNILLQILDEGKINDAQGRTVSFENTVIIMTSNAGSSISSGSLGFAKSEGDIAREKAMRALSDFLRPEFLARVDEVVFFRPLDSDDFRAIAKLMCDEYVAPLADKGVTLSFEQSALDWLASKTQGGKSAARDLRNLIRREVEDKLAQMLIESGGFPPAAAIVSAGENGIVIKY